MLADAPVRLKSLGHAGIELGERGLRTAERSTTVFLKNTTTVKVIYLLQVKFADGVYAPGIKEIEPGQTIALDLRQLRDDQVPDAFGNKIPRSAKSGQVTWAIKSTVQYAMIGRAEHTDMKNGVSASYACISCCPPRTNAVWVDDDPATVAVGGTVDLFVMAEDEDCYHNISSPYYMPWSWLNSYSFGNTSIATSYADSTATGISNGNTTFYADFPGVEYHVEGSESGWFCALDQTPRPVQAPVKSERCPGEETKSTMLEEYHTNNVTVKPACEDFATSGGSTNFSFSELNGGFSDGNPHTGVGIIKSALTTGLEATRTSYNRGGITLSSGYRCPHGNLAVDGVAQSIHMQGKAADMYSTDHGGTGWTETEFNLLRTAAATTSPTENLNWSSYTDRHLHVAW